MMGAGTLTSWHGGGVAWAVKAIGVEVHVVCVSNITLTFRALLVELIAYFTRESTFRFRCTSVPWWVRGPGPIEPLPRGGGGR